MTRLSPTTVMVWRSASELQIGIDEPVVLDGLAPDEARVIEALRSGAATSAVSHPDASRLRTLLQLLGDAGVLVPDEALAEPLLFARAAGLGRPGGYLRERTSRARVLVDGPVSTLMRDAAVRAGLACVSLARVDDSGGPRETDVAVVSSWYLPEWFIGARLTEASVPHLPLVLAHDRVRVGPLVLPGSTPCTSCEYLARLGGDPHWADIAQDLARRRPPWAHADAALVQYAVTSLALDLRRWITLGPTALPGWAVGISGRRESLQEFAFHPHCHCRHPAGGESPLLPRTSATNAAP